jgi:hypothetical protein
MVCRARIVFANENGKLEVRGTGPREVELEIRKPPSLVSIKGHQTEGELTQSCRVSLSSPFARLASHESD